MIALLAALLMGFAESYRGATAGLPRFLEKCILGVLALIALVGPVTVVEMARDWTFVAAYLVLFSAACSVSWGAVISGSLNRTPDDVFQAHIDAKQDKGDWYLIGPFRRSAMRGLFARSVVWGVLASVPLFAFGYTGEGIAMLAIYSAAMPLAVKALHAVEGSRFDRAIGRLCMALVDKDKPWARHEVYRGWIAGGLLVLAGAAL
jgi:hypothetical protein